MVGAAPAQTADEATKLIARLIELDSIDLCKFELYDSTMLDITFSVNDKSIDRRRLGRRQGISDPPSKTPDELAADEQARRYSEMMESDDEKIWWPLR